MRPDEHLTHELMVSALDDELTHDEAASAERHLSHCAMCRKEYEKLRALSVRLVAVFAANDEAPGAAARESLTSSLEAQEHAAMPAARRPYRIMQRAGWAAAIAAGLVIAAVFLPWTEREQGISTSQARLQQANGTIEIAGETFVALPYSNPDLPMNGPRIIQMQVPIASLAEAGVPLEPISMEAGDNDGSVLADVLIGLDGEPLGIHILSE